MHGVRLLCLLSLPLGGCSFIDDFNFTVRDLDAGNEDGAGEQDAERDGPTFACPDPCIGDAVTDFVTATQDSGTLRWRYQRDLRDPVGLATEPLVWDSWRGLSGWASSAGAPPAIVSCSQHPKAPECAGLDGRLLVVTDAPGGARSDPVLTFEATEAGTYRLSFDLRTRDGSPPSDPARVLVSRNMRNDMVLAQVVEPSEVPSVFTVDIDLFEAERGLVSIVPDPKASVAPEPVGLRVAAGRVVEGSGASLEHCLFAVTFEGASPLTDRCGQRTLTHESDPTQDVESVSPLYGRARDFDQQALLSNGSVLDYSGDITVQMWALVTEPVTRFRTFFDDRNDRIGSVGGVTVAANLTGARTTVSAVAMDSRTPCPSPACVVCSPQGACVVEALGPRPVDGQWHFYRLVRSTADSSLRICVDGVSGGTATLPGDLDITGYDAPALGNTVYFSHNRLVGSLDDVRVFRRALPCL